MTQPGRFFGDLATNLVAAALLAGPMVLAAAGVAALLFVVGAGPHWHWSAWVIVAPVMYLGWVSLYLAIAALVISWMGGRYPKPRHMVMRPGQPASPEGLGIRTAVMCYMNMAIVETLPLARATGRVPWLSTLWLRAYSPALKLGRGVINIGYMVDPDLTEVGDNTVLGAKSVLVAHVVAARPDGDLVFTSAPIKIGRRVTLGGEAYVGLGCVIGDDAILEPRAVAAPFTHIPSGEVWAGVPAVFVRKRPAVELSQRPAEASLPVYGPATEVDATEIMSRGKTSVAVAELRELVISTLQLNPAEAPAEPNSSNCVGWDSLGQVTIAAALFDRYGIAVSGEDVFRLHTLGDIAELISKGGHGSADVDRHGRGVSADKPSGAESVSSDGGAPTPPAPSLLPADVDMLPLWEPQLATAALAARFDRPPSHATHLRVCIAASFTCQPLAPAIRAWGRAFGLEIDCRFVDYDQIAQALLDPRGLFADNPGGVNVVLTRPEDLSERDVSDPTARMDDLLAALRGFVAGGEPRGQLLVGTLPPVVSAYHRLSEGSAGRLRDRWNTAVQGIAGVELLEFGRIVEHLGVAGARSSQDEVLTRTPYSPQTYQRLGIALVRSIVARRRTPAKVIALDCDNTLWGGIVGEVGLHGIQLGADGPGRSFRLFQQHLKSLQARGFLLVVASRNELHDVRAVFEKHPDMVLRPADIAAWRVNWERKSDNICALAEELGLGLDSFVFLDDDPVVQVEVRSLLPAVHVVPLAGDPSQYCDLLDRLWLFDGAVTAVDASRTRLVHNEGRRQIAANSFGSLDEFLAGLDLRVEIAPPAEHEWARVAQLTQRTNQFNLSLRRRTLEEIRNLAAERQVMVLKAQDRFGEYGLVGAAVLVPPDPDGVCDIDTLLLSCRALGRGVEDALLHGVTTAARRQGATLLGARFIGGPRNEQVKAFLVRHGFSEVQEGVFTLPLDAPSPLPRHIRLVESGAVESGATDSARTTAVRQPAETG